MTGWRRTRILLTVLLVFATATVGMLAGSGLVGKAAAADPPYTLTYVAGAGGTISGDNPQPNIPLGGSGTQVTAVPNTGYHFVSWSDGVLTAARTDTNVTDNLSVSATFAINTYTLAYTAGAGGTISGTTPQTVNYAGSGTQVTAVPNTGYHFVSWSDGVLTPARTDTNVTDNLSVSATFAIDTFTITPQAVTNGTITPATQQTVNYGATPLFTIAANTGYHVTAVLVDGLTVVTPPAGTVSYPYTFPAVTANHTISATFAIDTFTITPQAVTNGTITPATQQTVNYGATPLFTIAANTGYHVTAVLVDGLTVVTPPAGTVSYPYTFPAVTANHTISATFAIDTFTITPQAVTNGTITPATQQTVNYGATPLFTIAANTGYHVTAVLVDGLTVVTPPAGTVSYPYTFPAVTANHTISATFAIDTFTITYTPGAGGTISGTTPQTVNYAGSGTQVTAVPNTGYHFVSWSDGVLTAARTDANVTTNLSATANFAIDTYTLAPSTATNGAITPATVQTVSYSATQAFTITPALHYYIADVLVDGVSVGPVTSYSFTAISANHTISASFAAGAQTRISINTAATTVEYGRSTLLTGVLYNSSDPLNEVGMGGRLVALQSASSAAGPWTDVQTLTTSSAAGSVGKCTAAVMPTRPTYYRLRFVAGTNSDYGSSLSFVMRVGVRPVLSKPIVPSTATVRRSFTVYGLLKPRFAPGWKMVKISVYRYKNSRWVSVAQVSATNVNSGSNTRYNAKLRLTTKGKYRFRAATLPTSVWAGSTSPYSNGVSVR